MYSHTIEHCDFSIKGFLLLSVSGVQQHLLQDLSMVYAYIKMYKIVFGNATLQNTFRNYTLGYHVERQLVKQLHLIPNSFLNIY